MDGVMVQGWPGTEEMPGRPPEGDGFLGTILKGAVAGAAAVWVMDRVDWALWDAEDSRTRAETRRVRPGGMDPAHVLANRVARAVGTELSPRQPHPAGIATHYAIGVAPAMLYAALRRQSPAVAAGGGTLFGLGLSVVEDEGLNPLLGLSAPLRDYPWQDHARGIVAHLVFGAVLEGALRALDGPPGKPRRLLA